MEQKIGSLKDILELIPQDLSIKEKARKAYILLGQNSFYNPEYKYLFGCKQYDMFNASDGFVVPNIGVCKQFAAQYKYLLNSLGIKTRVAITEQDEFGTYHPDIFFYDEDGNQHLANLAVDLSRIQSHCKTKHFGSATISEEELRQIDLKIGYITPEHGYTDDYFSEINEFMSQYDLTETERVDMMFRLLPKFFDLSKMGDDEQYKALSFMIGRVFGCKDSIIYRSHDSEAGQENYYIKSFNQAKDAIPPHSDYKLFNKNTRVYDDIDYKELDRMGIVKNREMYY